MVVVASIFHWRLFRRRGADVQHSATLTQRNSRYGLMSASRASEGPLLGVKRTCLFAGASLANDPKQTLPCYEAVGPRHWN